MNLILGTSILTSDDLKSHIHIKGVSRSGKSKCIELVCRELTRQGYGWTLIDPHSTVIEAILPYLKMYKRKNQKVYLVRPNAEKTCGYDPFLVSDVSDSWAVHTQADEMV